MNKTHLTSFAGLALFLILFLLPSAQGAAPADFPLRSYFAVFEYDGIDAVISRAKSMNADALGLPMEGPNQGSTHFSAADFAKANNITNNNGLKIEPVLWTDITMKHSGSNPVIDMNVLTNRDAAIAQLELDIIAHPGIYAVELEETGHNGYTTTAMNDLLTKARDAAHRHGVQLWVNQPTMAPWSSTPPLGGWDVGYINSNNVVDAYILQNGDVGDTSSGAKGNMTDVLSCQQANEARMPNINVVSIAYAWSAASENTPKCIASPGTPECWVQSFFTAVNYFNSRGRPVQMEQVNWGMSADYSYYDTAGYGPGTVLGIMSRIPINYSNPLSARITAPTNNATLSAPANITITATASDSGGTVTNVEFYAGSTLLGRDSTSPYSMVWSNVPAGAYTLSAKAADNRGAYGTSAPIVIFVVGTGGQ